MFNVLSSIIFAKRNVDKVQTGDIGRAPVAAAQAASVFNEVAHYNKKIAKGADAAISAVETYAKSHKAAGYALKGVKWATNNVNTMIVASSVLKVARTEKGKRKKTAIKEGTAITAMLAGERIAKAVLPKLIKGNSKLGLVIKGLAFVGASIGSYAIGEKIGEDLGNTIDANSSVKAHNSNPFACTQNVNCMA